LVRLGLHHQLLHGAFFWLPKKEVKKNPEPGEATPEKIRQRNFQKQRIPENSETREQIPIIILKFNFNN
jgi:hypothetical protein